MAKKREGPYKLGDKVNKKPSAALQKRRSTKYRKERVHGRKTALDELEQEDTIYMLANQLTYIHSKKVYYKAGQKTALQIVQRSLNSIEQQTKKAIPRICRELDTRLNKVIKACHKKNWETFEHWWETELMNANWIGVDPDSAVRLQLLGLLDEWKQGATKIQMYEMKRQKGNQTGQYQQLYDTGLVRVGVPIEPNKAIKDPDSPIVQIRETQKEIYAKIIAIIDKFHPGYETEYVKTALEHLQKGTAASTLDYLNAKDIGRLEEAFSDGIERIINNGVHTYLVNVSNENKNAERKGKQLEASRSYVGSTTDTEWRYGLDIVLPMSDKSGMLYNWQVDQKNQGDTGVLDRFTANISATNFDIARAPTSGFIDTQSFDPHLQAVILYILRNEDFWNAGKGTNAKYVIVALFAWLKVISEVVGITTDYDSMPLVIKAFNRLYKTSDLLKQFLQVNGTGILTSGLVTQAWQANMAANINEVEWYVDAEELRAKKGEEIMFMKQNGIPITYKNLKGAITPLLNTVNWFLFRKFDLSTHFNIIYNNARVLAAGAKGV